MNKRIGLVGAGNMASALVRGLIASGSVTNEGVRASDPNGERLRELTAAHAIVTHTDNHELVVWADIVVLAVKPQALTSVLTEIAPLIRPEQLLISIAAGVPIAAIEAILPAGSRVVRAMPNTAAIVLAGATGVAAGSRATAEDVTSASALFEAVGRVVVVDESSLDAVTGLSGSGPAYVMMVIEALADGGVKVGLTREAALLLAAQTLYGSAKLQLETKEHPARLRDMVASPGGTTIAGIHALESGGLRPALINAVEQATQRSRELGSQAAARLAKG
jgi:pyrroline-5-carboxylate reductase